MIVAYVPDLMDRSKIVAAAPEPVRFVATPAELTTATAGADLVLVDLARPGAIEAIAAMTATSTTDAVESSPAAPPPRRVIGFAPHVDHQRLDEASAAGCTEVLARRDLFRRLDQVLADPAPGGP